MTLISDRYQLEERIGAGGMGEVFRALDRLTGETIALKRVTTHPQGLEFSTRLSSASAQNFRAALVGEFRILASLHHPHIINVLDFGFDADQYPFFTMPYLENAPAILEHGLLQPFQLKLRYLQQLLQALAYLHRRGILHRDLKSANVLLENDQVRVLDFGLSVEVNQSHILQAGTLSYMSPELLRRQPASPQSDLYAVGVLAYQLFTGIYPFPYQNVNELFAAILKHPVDFDIVPAEMGIRKILTRLMERDPQKRFASAEATMQALSAAQGTSSLMETAAVRESYLTAAQFVGREAELVRLTQALRASTQGQGSFWLIGGESGVGKSRLLDELRIQALVQNVRVIRGQDVSDGGAFYHLWRDPVRRLILSTPVQDAEILRELVPDIENLLGIRIDPLRSTQTDPNTLKDRLLLAVQHLFSQQQHPLLLLLEDLQWSLESLEILQAVMVVVADLPVMVVGTYRLEERPDLPLQFPQAQQIILERLSRESIAELSRSILGEEGLQIVDFLQQEAEGNVFFVVEIIRALAEEAGRLGKVTKMTLPERIAAKGIEEVIQRRLERIPDWAYTLLTLAAVQGRQLDLKILAVLHEVPVSLETWLSACANAAVITLVEGRWQFAHDKLRERLLKNLAPAARAVFHQMVAEAIESIYPNDETHAFALASHWQMVGDQKRELPYVLIAVQQAMSISSYREAIKLGVHALELIPPNNEEAMNMLRLLGNAHYQLSNYAQAESYLKESLKIAQALNHTQGITEAFLQLADLRGEQGDYHVARAHAKQALSLATQQKDHRLVMLASHLLGRMMWFLGEYDAAGRYYEEGLNLARQINDPRGIAQSLVNLARMAGEFGDYSMAKSYLEETLNLQNTLKDQRGIATTLNELGFIMGRLGDLKSAQRYLEQAITLEQRIGSQAGLAQANEYLAEVLERQGQSAKAKAYFITSVELRRKIGERPGIVYSLIGLAFNHLALGEMVKARTDLKEALALALEMDAQPKILEVMVGWAWLRLLEQDALGSAALLGCLLQQPAMTEDIINTRVIRLQSEIRQHLNAEDAGRAIQQGKQLNFESLVQSYSSL